MHNPPADIGFTDRFADILTIIVMLLYIQKISVQNRVRCIRVYTFEKLRVCDLYLGSQTSISDKSIKLS